MLRVPVVGGMLRTGWYISTLPNRMDYLERTLDQQSKQAQKDNSKHATGLEKLSNAIGQTNTLLTGLEAHQAKTEDAVVDIKHRLLLATPATSASSDKKTGSELLADDHDLDDFYIKFEDKFRGTEAEIKERQRVYIPYLRELGIDFSKHPVIDIGCGRGEFLALLKEEKIRAIGIDLNQTMVERCKKNGFEAIQIEALSYLKDQAPGSLGAITGFHIVEHIPFNFLLRLFEECYRVLTPGGMIIFETPNPENIHVGSYSFYFDPSHLHPLSPDVLAFAVKNRGFDKVDILRLHPKGDGHELEPERDPYVNELINRFYTAQDYSVLGYRANLKRTR